MREGGGADLRCCMWAMAFRVSLWWFAVSDGDASRQPLSHTLCALFPEEASVVLLRWQYYPSSRVERAWREGGGDDAATSELRLVASPPNLRVT